MEKPGISLYAGTVIVFEGALTQTLSDVDVIHFHSRANLFLEKLGLIANQRV